ncbi:MAG: nucleotidyltransferase family protein [Pseudomonadota bacterium]|nr:nucleotidyltransferase family protein [Pseudomonadota bacterium]
MMLTNAIVLAAGQGSRLKPLTNDWPKCLMPIHGVPILEYWLSDLIASSVSPIIVNTHYHAQLVADYLSRPRFNSIVQQYYEANLLGTAGTIRALSNKLLKGPTLIIHGDNWCEFPLINLVNFHTHTRPTECPISMLTFDTDTPETCGILELDSKNIVQQIYEKKVGNFGTTANAAVYVIEPEVVHWIVENKSNDFSTDVLPAFLGRIATIHNTGFHYDIGSAPSLCRAQSTNTKSLIWEKEDLWLHKFSNHKIHQSISSLCTEN